MKRREFITLLGGAATVWPACGARAAPVMPVVGFLRGASPVAFTSLVAARAMQPALPSSRTR